MAQLSLVWKRQDLKNPHRLPDKSLRVKGMFSEIASTYDRLNRLLSMGLDRSWRNRAIALAQLQPGERVLDLCCGTGEFSWAALKAQNNLSEVVGVDFSPAMLKIAHGKTYHTDRSNDLQIQWLCQDAQQLDLPKNHFDCVLCGFGLRNLSSPPDGLAQAWQVLKPGGRLILLEFFPPTGLWHSWLVQGYLRLVLPLIGGIIAGDRCHAYRYLPESVRSFYTRDEMESLAQQAGFTGFRWERYPPGVVLALKGIKHG